MRTSACGQSTVSCAGTAWAAIAAILRALRRPSRTENVRTLDIVVTTIFDPAWLPGYLSNIRAHGREDVVTIRIVADRKTPASVFEAARAAAADGFRIDCPSLDEQTDYLRRLGLPENFIPWNTDNRRNIGYLRAWESGADVLISIDDDNYCRDDSDFIGAHDVVGSPAGEAGASDVAGGADWLNICAFLDGPDETIYARGFPYDARGTADATLSPLDGSIAEQVVAVNAGLWLDDPDVDAITRLALRPRCDAARAGAVVLAPQTWTPVNTQNTALHRAAIPSYYYVRMGFPLRGMRIDRFGDIWSGYFLQACARALGEVVRVGDPVADHHRQTHNLFLDLHQELAGIVLTEDLVPWLRELRITGSDYAEAYEALAESIAAEADRFTGFIWDDGGREFLRETADHMRTWLRAIRTVSDT